MRPGAALGLLAACVSALGADSTARRPQSDEDLRFWLENMISHHRFTTDEVTAATGLSAEEVKSAQQRLGVREKATITSPPGKVRMLPYPGGRHPRIGFLDGAIDPQRETKISVFTPWDDQSYVVVDVPEAIWSQHGLIYLAHTHVPTIWTKQNVTLPPLEWTRHADGRLSVQRKLPNGVVFGASAEPLTNSVRMELWLTNGTGETLRDLRVQNCVMLKAAAGFNQQTNANKIFQPPFIACGSPDGARWIITAWTPLHRAWANPPVPCLHSDPKFPDCAPGETQRVRGSLWFYEGRAITNELNRLSKLL
jgi:hypothetical protein